MRLAVTRPERVAALGARVAVDASGAGYVIPSEPIGDLVPFAVAARVSGGRYALESPEGPHFAVAASDFLDALDGYATLWGGDVLEPADRADGERAAKYLAALESAGPHVLGLPVSP